MRAPFNRTLRIEEGCLIVPLELIERRSYKASFDTRNHGVAQVRFFTPADKHEAIRKELSARWEQSERKPVDLPNPVSEISDHDLAVLERFCAGLHTDVRFPSSVSPSERARQMLSEASDKDLQRLYAGDHEKLGPLLRDDVRREMERRGVKPRGRP